MREEGVAGLMAGCWIRVLWMTVGGTTLSLSLSLSLSLLCPFLWDTRERR